MRGVHPHSGEQVMIRKEMTATEAEDRMRAQVAIYVEALRLMTQSKPCDCGCELRKPIFLAPKEYYGIARDALAEAREVGASDAG